MAIGGVELQRGVWEAPYRVDGVRVLIAVDRFGNARKHVKLTAKVDPIRAADWLSQLLDRIDPLPELRLVKPPERAPTIDPEMYSDPRSPYAEKRYRQAIARRAADAFNRHRLR